MYRPVDGTGSGQGAAEVEGEAESGRTARGLAPADDLPGGGPARAGPTQCTRTKMKGSTNRYTNRYTGGTTGSAVRYSSPWALPRPHV